jgi:hypothetical protein
MPARLGNVLLWASILIAGAIIYAGYGVIPITWEWPTQQLGCLADWMGL